MAEVILDPGGCGVGKHSACSGRAWDVEADKQVSCSCCDRLHQDAFGRVTQVGRVRSELQPGERPVTGL